MSFALSNVEDAQVSCVNVILERRTPHDCRWDVHREFTHFLVLQAGTEDPPAPNIWHGVRVLGLRYVCSQFWQKAGMEILFRIGIQVQRTLMRVEMEEYGVRLIGVGFCIHELELIWARGMPSARATSWCVETNSWCTTNS
jgi:hypothetical protein